MVDLTKVMREACGAKLVAVTCGEDSSILATEHLVSLGKKFSCNLVPRTFVQLGGPKSQIHILVRHCEGNRISF